MTQAEGQYAVPVTEVSGDRGLLRRQRRARGYIWGTSGNSMQRLLSSSPENQAPVFLPSATFSRALLVAWNQPQWEYLYCGAWPILQICAFSFRGLMAKHFTAQCSFLGSSHLTQSFCSRQHSGPLGSNWAERPTEFGRLWNSSVFPEGGFEGCST